MKTRFLFIATILCFAFLSGCAGVSDSPRRVVVSWDDLPGWRADDHAAAVPVFLRSCETLRGEEWKTPCAAAARLSPVSSSAARQFFETHFLPHRLLTAAGGDEGLITGYYEPLFARRIFAFRALSISGVRAPGRFAAHIAGRFVSVFAKQTSSRTGAKRRSRSVLFPRRN